MQQEISFYSNNTNQSRRRVSNWRLYVRSACIETHSISIAVTLCRSWYDAAAWIGNVVASYSRVTVNSVFGTNSGASELRRITLDRSRAIYWSWSYESMEVTQCQSACAGLIFVHLIYPTLGTGAACDDCITREVTASFYCYAVYCDAGIVL